MCTAPPHARTKPTPRAEHTAELQVVFDEYHFGKFVNGYITGEYFFDIHPPLGKLLLCLVAWMGGYCVVHRLLICPKFRILISYVVQYIIYNSNLTKKFVYFQQL